MYANSIHLIDYISIFARGELIRVNHIKSYKQNRFHQVIVKLLFAIKDGIAVIGILLAAGLSSTQNNQRCEIKPLENLIYEKFDKNKKFIDRN